MYIRREAEHLRIVPASPRSGAIAGARHMQGSVLGNGQGRVSDTGRMQLILSSTMPSRHAVMVVISRMRDWRC